MVTIAPLAGLVKPLLPPDAALSILMPPGRSEHGYEFTPGDIAAIGKADLIVCIGAGLEPAVADFLSKHPDPRRRVVTFASPEIAGAEFAGESHDHDHDHDHHDHAIDVHVWLDPSLCVKLVAAIESQLQAALRERGASEAASKLASSAAAQRKQIEKVDEEYRSKLASLQGQSIITHHNAWQRIADRYGLKVAAAMRGLDEGEMTPGAVAGVVDAIKKEGVRAIFIEPQFDRAAAERIAAQAGVKVAVLDPLGDGDWFKMMRSNLDSLVGALGK